LQSNGGTSHYKRIFHVCPPIYNKEHITLEKCQDIITQLTYNLLKKCTEQKISSICIPPFSAGRAGVPIPTVALSLFNGFK